MSFNVTHVPVIGVINRESIDQLLFPFVLD